MSFLDPKLDMMAWNERKSLLKSYNFKFWFGSFGGSSDTILNEISDLMVSTIESWYFTDVSIPTYNFERTSMQFGTAQRSFVTLPAEQNLNVTATIEEDRYGNVAKLIALLQQTIVSRAGYYRPPSTQYIDTMYLDVLDDQGYTVSQYKFGNVLFMGADDITFSYAQGEAIKYTLHFGVDRIEYASVNDPVNQNKPIVPIGIRIGQYSLAASRRAAGVAYSELRQHIVEEKVKDNTNSE